MIVDIRQMLMPILADVIAMVHDRCYCHVIKADVIASYMLFYGRCYCHVMLGRCYFQFLCGRC